jgi:predicted ATPase
VIRQVHFKNFRCLRDVELTLEPLTVLVGPNSSGKTTVLDGLRPREVLSHEDLWQQKDDAAAVHWVYSDNTRQIAWHKVPPSIHQYRYVPQKHSLQSLTLDLNALRSNNLLNNEVRLSSNGSNLTNVFGTLTRQQQSAVAQELCRLVPMFRDVDLDPVSNGNHRLRFQDRWNPELWFAPKQVSDGTMLMLAFIVLQYQNPPVDLITIEEPERALHPYLLDELIQMLRKMSTGEIGKKPVQVVLATHSAELLDYVRPEEVRFLTRSQEDGSVQVNQATTDTTNWRRVYEEYNQSLGSIWLSGGMGGVPGA